MNKRNLILAGFILLKFVLQYVLIDSVYELHRDEFLYLDQANHLSWGYLSTPPFTSWVALLIKLLGKGEFWIRFFPALAGAFTLVFVWKTVEELKGSIYALILVGVAFVLSVFVRLNILFQPNAFDVLAWTGTYYFLIKYINSSKKKWILWTAVMFAFGVLNKYNIGFLVLGLLPALVFTKQRTLFVKREFLWAALVAIVIVLPNLVWQYNNDFPVVFHMGQLTKYHLAHLSRLDFLREQVLYFVGPFFVIVAAVYSLLFYHPFEKYRFLGLGFVFTLVVFVFFKAKGYYALGLYPIYMAFGAVFLSEIAKSKVVRVFLIVFPAFIFVRMTGFFFPNKTPQYIVENPKKYVQYGMLTWEDGKQYLLPQDFADMLGWKELAAKVEKAYNATPNPEETLILCDNYGQAGAINFYSKGRLKAASFHADYINWIDLSKQYKHLIRVKEAGKREDEMKETAHLFERAFLADSVANRFAREYKADIFSFINATININEPIQKERDELLKREEL